MLNTPILGPVFCLKEPAADEGCGDACLHECAEEDFRAEIERLGCALIATTDTSSTTRLAPAAST